MRVTLVVTRVMVVVVMAVLVVVVAVPVAVAALVEQEGQHAQETELGVCVDSHRLLASGPHIKRLLLQLNFILLNLLDPESKLQLRQGVSFS